MGIDSSDNDKLHACSFLVSIMWLHPSHLPKGPTWVYKSDVDLHKAKPSA